MLKSLLKKANVFNIHKTPSEAKLFNKLEFSQLPASWRCIYYADSPA